MNDQEIRAAALMAAAKGAVNPGIVIENARRFATFIKSGGDIGATPVVVPGKDSPAPQGDCQPLVYDSTTRSWLAQVYAETPAFMGQAASDAEGAMCPCGHPRDKHRVAGCFAPTPEDGRQVFCRCERANGEAPAFMGQAASVEPEASQTLEEYALSFTASYCSGWKRGKSPSVDGCSHPRNQHGNFGCFAPPPEDADTVFCPCERVNGA